MGIRINDPKTWIETWEKALSESAKNMHGKAGFLESVDQWNLRARQFTANRGFLHSKSRQFELLERLQQLGAFKAGFKVLDIGAGSGRYSIPFAKMGADVVAIEPAISMAEHLQHNIEQEQVTNVTIVNQPWQTVDLKREIFQGGFDLVFASMTPGISSPTDLIKMMDASTHACYLSAHTKQRWQHVEAFWKEFYRTELPESPGNFMYRFGLLYAMGYSPVTLPQNTKHRTKSWVHSPERIKEDIIGSFRRYSEVTGELEMKIDEYLESRQEKEDDQQHDREILSMAMVWFVD